MALGAIPPVATGQDKEPALEKVAERLLGSVEQLSRGEQRERGAIVSAILERQGWKVEPHSFQAGELSGTNLMVKVQEEADQEDKPLTDRTWLVLGAHMDRVAKGRGAVDNGGGCAALMELCQRLKEKPLEKVRVWAVYFDLEENGLLGSDAFARQLEAKPTLYVNLDVFAYGDQVWLHSQDEADGIVEAAKKVDADHPFSFDHGVSYPPSDHLSFRKAGIEAASFSLLRPVDVQQLEGMFAGKSKDRPEVLQLIHTEEDQPQKIDAQQMAQGVDFVEATLRQWSEQMQNSP
jgi:Zn-dependent M28 family amino/carboxypeptidase